MGWDSPEGGDGRDGRYGRDVERAGHADYSSDSLGGKQRSNAATHH